MKIISTNIGKPRVVKWKKGEVTTGIFKQPVNQPLVLEKTDVEGDHVIDRKYHGGVDKACYLYSADHYPFWKQQYSNLNWQYGMFGENLTIEGLDETAMHIGDTYEIGSAVVQISQPRQPCFKLGIKFEDPGVLRKFIAQSYSGIYVRIITEGEVNSGDALKLVKREGNGLSVADVFQLLYNSKADNPLKQKVIEDQHLPPDLRDYIIGRL